MSTTLTELTTADRVMSQRMVRSYIIAELMAVYD